MGEISEDFELSNSVPKLTPTKGRVLTAVDRQMPVYKPIEEAGRRSGSGLKGNLGPLGVMAGGAVLMLLGLWKLGEIIYWLI